MRRCLVIACWGISVAALAQPDVQKSIQTRFIEAEDGATIELPAGTLHFDGSLSIDGKKNLTIRGAGMDKTILSFKGQLSGAEGIKVTNCSNIVIHGLTVQDTKGDAL